MWRLASADVEVLFALAHDIADRLGHGDATLVHIALGALRERRSVAVRALFQSGRTEFFGCEHVLLALLREETGLPAQALARHGVRFDDVQAESAHLQRTARPIALVRCTAGRLTSRCT
jgi:ClpA/ClpB-like protein